MLSSSNEELVNTVLVQEYAFPEAVLAERHLLELWKIWPFFYSWSVIAPIIF